MIDLSYTLERMLCEIKYDKGITFPCTKVREWERTDLRFMYAMLNNMLPMKKTPYTNPIVHQMYTEPLQHDKWPRTYFILLNKIAEDHLVIPEHDAAAYALENAFFHGGVPVTVRMFIGLEGAVYSIEDSGSGFDVQRKCGQFSRWSAGINEVYWKNQGEGFRVCNDPLVTTSFNPEGNGCWIMLHLPEYNRVRRDRLEKVRQKYRS